MKREPSTLLPGVALALALGAPAAGQEPAAEPLVRARIEPETPVTIGEPVRLVVDVLTPTWFFSAPRFPSLDVEAAFVLLQDRGLNLTETLGPTSFSGIRREYLVYPMRPGTFEIPSFEVTVVFAVDAKRSDPTTLRTPMLRFEAVVPEAARGLRDFVSATRLVLDQRLDPEPTRLEVGGAVRRTITTEAEGALGMMLPALHLEPIDGLTAYADPPQVEDGGDERTEGHVARRMETITYRLERAGEYRLPGVEIGWWDTRARRLRTASLPPITLAVSPGREALDGIPLPAESPLPPAQPAHPRRDVLSALVPWLAAGLGLVLAALWVLPHGRRLVAWPLAMLRERRDSEAAWFARIRQAAAAGDPPRTYRALLAWLERRAPDAGTATLEAFLSTVRDRRLDAEVARLSEILFGPPRTGGSAWSGRTLVERLGAARRLQRVMGPVPRGSLPPLNPRATTSHLEPGLSGWPTTANHREPVGSGSR